MKELKFPKKEIEKKDHGEIIFPITQKYIDLAKSIDASYPELPTIALALLDMMKDQLWVRQFIAQMKRNTSKIIPIEKTDNQ